MAKLSQTFRLEPHARKKIEKRRAAEKDARLHNRLSALLWLAEGRTRDEVARLLGVHVRTIKNWLKLYLKGGLTALCTLSYKGDVGNLSVAQGQQLKTEVATGRFKCAAEACAWVEATFGVTGSVPTKRSSSCVVTSFIRLDLRRWWGNCDTRLQFLWHVG